MTLPGWLALWALCSTSFDDDGGYLDWLAANPEGLSSTPPAIRHRRTSYCIVPVGLLAGSERVVIAGPLTMLSTATNVPNWKRSGKVTATTCLAPAPCLADGSLPHTTPDRRGGAPASATGETELRVVAQVTGVMILHAR